MSYMTTMGMLLLLLWLKGALHYVEQALAVLLLVVHGSTLFAVDRGLGSHAGSSGTTLNNERSMKGCRYGSFDVYFGLGQICEN